jgi:hypothetical protein
MVGSAGKENLNDVGRGLKQATEAGKDECATVCSSLLVKLSCIDSPSTLKMRDPNRLRQGSESNTKAGGIEIRPFLSSKIHVQLLIFILQYSKYYTEDPVKSLWNLGPRY